MTPKKTTILIESYEPDSKVYGPKKGGEHRGVGHQINRFQCQIRPPQIMRTEKNVGLVRELLSPGSKAGPVKPS